ncbi:MAG: helix-turn-helix transcriptional regulator [Lachnospiraceae bacterium]|nr:helix-turn-helix transcriptional regulator [Lachnospiraceae bacterium]
MPKVFQSDCDRKIYAFRRWFKGKCRSKDITQAQLARKMGIAQASLSYKMQTAGNNSTQITYRDLLCFFREVNATDEEILHYMKL